MKPTVGESGRYRSTTVRKFMAEPNSIVKCTHGQSGTVVGQ